MLPSLRAAGAAATLALVALTASDTCSAEEVLAYAEERPEIDYDAFFAALPQIRDLAKESLDHARELHEAMLRLTEFKDDSVKVKEARAAARDLLVNYRDNKSKLVGLIDAVLKKAPPTESDLAIMKKLRETELVGVAWDKTKFIDCLRDLARAVGVRFVMHPDVLKFNTIEARFPRTSADGILRAITTGFDCEYIIHEGEIIVIKSLKRNDKRIQQYLDKHPEWTYWRPEEVKEVEDDL